MKHFAWLVISFLCGCCNAQANHVPMQTREGLYVDSTQHKDGADTLYDQDSWEVILSLLQERTAYQEISLTRQKRFIIALCALAVLLIIGAVFLVRNSKRTRRANDLLTLKSLRSQMNPHFIFNALNSVNGFISNNDTREANRYLSDFSRLMRIVMENSQKDFVPLDEEIAALKLYLNLEHMRFKEIFAYQFVVDENVTTHLHRIPPMLVQPYIENAVWHGLRYKKEQGFLSVTLTKDETYLLLGVTDNGIGRAQSKQRKTRNQQDMESTGMKNTEARLQLLSRLYRCDLSVSVRDLDEGEDTGTDVLLKIPLSLTEEIS